MVNVHVATIGSKSIKVDVFKEQKPTKNKSVVSVGKKRSIWRKFHVWHHIIDASDSCACTSKNRLKECNTSGVGMLDLVIPIETSKL